MITFNSQKELCNAGEAGILLAKLLILGPLVYVLQNRGPTLSMLFTGK
jgi:hypothetical protein